MNNLNVVPFDVTTVKTVAYITININNIVLSQSAQINVTYYDASDNIVSINPLLLAGEDYSNWGANDSYIINFVCTSLNITILNTASISVNNV
jgi:hypothetical protein